LRKISVIGHSMGGKAAMQFACEYPHRVQKLVVVDIAPRTYHLLHQNIIDALKSINLIKIQSRQDADKQLANQIYSQVMRQFFLKNLYRLQDGKFAWRLNLEAIEKNLPLLGEGLKKNNKFEKPALFIRGSNSDFIKEDDFEKIKFHFPAAEITTIKNATHWLHVEKTEKFLNLIKSFL